MISLIKNLSKIVSSLDGLSNGNVFRQQSAHSQSSIELRSDESTNYKFRWKTLGLWKKVMLLGGVL